MNPSTPLASASWDIVDSGGSHPENIYGAAEIRIAANPASASADDRDGKFVYITARDGDNVAVYQRNLNTQSTDFGRLSLVGTTGAQLYLDGARGLALSPNLAHVYATGRNSNTLVVFDRNPTTGLLTLNEVWQDSTTNVSGLTVPPERRVANLKLTTNVVVSPDGNHVYVTSGGTQVNPATNWQNWDASFLDSSVTVFTRNTTTGKLSLSQQLTDGQVQGSATVDGLRGAINLALTPDGSQLFVTGHVDGVGTSRQDSGALAQFERNPTTGQLTFVAAERMGGLTAAAGRGGPISQIQTATISPGVMRPQVTPAQGHLAVVRGDWLAIAGSSDTEFNKTIRVDGIQSDGKYSLAAPTRTGMASGGTATWMQSKMRGALGVAVSPNGRTVYTANYGTPASIGPTGTAGQPPFGYDGSVAAFALFSPRVTGVKLRSTATQVERDIVAVAGTGQQLVTVALAKPQELKIVFDQPVAIDQADLTLAEANGTSSPPAISGFSFDDATFTATWTFAAPLGKGQWTLTLNADGTSPVAGKTSGSRLDGEWLNPNAVGSGQTSSAFPSGNGTAGGNFNFRFTVLRSAGDANADNTVGAADYSVWAATFGLTGTELAADFNGDGSVGAGDYAIWAANFGTNYTSWPSGMMLLAGGGGGGGGYGPAAAMQALLAYYGAGLDSDEDSLWAATPWIDDALTPVLGNWEQDATLLFGWDEETLLKVGLSGFLEELTAWTEQD